MLLTQGLHVGAGFMLSPLPGFGNVWKWPFGTKFCLRAQGKTRLFLRVVDTTEVKD
jgi:hypothetical protein